MSLLFLLIKSILPATFANQSILTGVALLCMSTGVDCGSDKSRKSYYLDVMFDLNGYLDEITQLRHKTMSFFDLSIVILLQFFMSFLLAE
jgi:hypothetical protein